MKNSKPLMKNIAKNLLSIGLVLCATATHADLVVDTRYNGASANLDKMSWDEKRRLFDPFFEKWEKTILQAIAEDNEGIAPRSAPGGRDSGHILWNGNHYYAWAVKYQSAAQYRLNAREAELMTAKKIKKYSPVLPGGGICALYVFDQELNKLAALKIDLPENNHGTWCNGTYGFGGAGKGTDGVLVTISYYLAGKKPAQRAQDIGRGWRYMTALIRFEEKNGKLVLRQDDSCLGNPNDYGTIPDARKALSKCPRNP